MQNLLACHHLHIDSSSGILQHNTQSGDIVRHHDITHYTAFKRTILRICIPHEAASRAQFHSKLPSSRRVLANYRQLGSSPLRS